MAADGVHTHGFRLLFKPDGLNTRLAPAGPGAAPATNLWT